VFQLLYSPMGYAVGGALYSFPLCLVVFVLLLYTNLAIADGGWVRITQFLQYHIGQLPFHAVHRCAIGLICIVYMILLPLHS
jgi:hypothetical protein